MKRLLLVSAMALLLLGSLGESVNCLNRPWTEDLGNPDPNSDHPWGGDNVTPGTSSGASNSGPRILPTTGIGSVDLMLRVYFHKYVTRFTNKRTVRATETTQPPVTIEGTTSPSSTSESTLTANQ